MTTPNDPAWISGQHTEHTSYQTHDVALRAAYAPRSRGSKTIALGDSIDQMSDQGSNYSAGSIFSALCILSNQRVKWLGNAGIGGNTTTQVLARVQTDAIAYNPGVVIIGGGVTNDHGQGFDPTTTRANLTAIRDALWAAGITVVVRNVPPTDNPGGGAYNTVATHRAVVQQHNAWLRNWAAINGIPLLDYYAPLVDETTGGYLSGLTGDGTHPTLPAAGTVAQSVINAGLPPCWTGIPQLTTAVGDGADLLAGTGLFLGAISGGVPAGWDHYGDAAATVSVVPDTAIPGNWVQLVGAGSGIHVIESSPIDGKWAIGDTLEFAFRVSKSGVADSNVRIKLTDQVGGNGNQVIRIEPAAGIRALSGVAVGRVVVPAGAISGYIEIITNPGETVKVGQVTVTNLTALGAA